MEIIQLQYFQMAAKLEHLTRAAEQLHITQPSLSKTISRLEESLGVQLFDREGNRIRLNAYGRTFLSKVDDILYLLDGSSNEVREMAGLEQGHVYIATGQQDMLHIPTTRFLKKYANAYVSHQLLREPEMIGALDERRVDFAVVSESAAPSYLDWEPVLDLRLFAHISEDHPLAKNGCVRLRDLSDMSLVRTGMGYSIPESISQTFEKNGFAPKIIYDGNDMQTIGRLVEGDVAASFITPVDYYNLLKREDRIPGGRALLITEPDISWRLGIASCRNHYFSQAALRYRAYLVAYFRELNAELERLYRL